MSQADHVGRARRYPAHGPAGTAGEPREQDLFGMRPGLGAEAATGVRGDDTDLIGRQPVHLCHHRPHRMRALAGRPVDESPVVAPQRRPGPALERAGGQTLVDQRGGHDHVAARERVPNRLRAALPRRHHVGARLGEQQHLTPFRDVELGDGRQRVVVDPDQLGRVLALRVSLADDGHDRLAHEPHAAVGQQRAGHGGWVGRADLWLRADVEICRSHDVDHARGRSSGVDVDGPDDRVRYRGGYVRDAQAAG